MFNFPVWSDFGQPQMNTQSVEKDIWASQMALFERYRYYFDGDVFRETVDEEGDPEEGEAPLLYPAGINLVKMLCMAQADSMFGEWDEQIFSYKVKGDGVKDDASQAAFELLGAIMAESSANSIFWELELDRNIYGGCVIKVLPDLNLRHHIRWARIPAASFYPIPDPDRPDELLEATVVTVLSKEQAEYLYHVKTDKDTVTRAEKWTKAIYSTTVDGQVITTLSGVNPYGFVPFVYIPRFRSSNWYGEALTPELIATQNELNLRVADIGDGISYNSHPIRWGRNLPRSFNTKNFPLVPNGLWDIGRTIGNLPPAEVGILEAKNAVAPGVFDYVKFIYDWTRTSSFAPPIAFGEDNGGGQRSGATLEIRMWPLLKAVRRSRAYFTSGIQRVLWMSGMILKQKGFSDIPVRAIARLIDGTIVPSFSEIMPRDHQAAVDEVVKLLSTEPKSISLETAQTILGRGPGEVDRIKNMLGDKKLLPEKKEEKPVEAKVQDKSNDPQEAMQGKQQPQEKSK